MRILYPSIFLLFFTFCLQGQIIKKSVALTAISYSSQSANSEIARSLHSSILNSMMQSPRLSVVARGDAFTAVSKEKNLQEGVDFVDGEVVRQGKAQGAGYVIFVHVNHAVANTVRNKNGELKGYEGEISLFCRIVNVESTEIIASAIITPKGYEQLTDIMLNANVPLLGQEITGGISISPYSQSPDQAIRKTMTQVEPNMVEFLFEVFPLEVMISDIQTNTTPKGKEETTVYIKGGRQLGLKKGATLEVKQVVDREIAGEILQEEMEIGKIKVIRVSENLVSCKIQSDEDFLVESYQKDRERMKAIKTSSGLFDIKF